VASRTNQERFERRLSRRPVDDRERRARGGPVVQKLPAAEVRRGEDQAFPTRVGGVKKLGAADLADQPERMLGRAAPDRSGLGDCLAGLDDAFACKDLSLFRALLR